MLTVEEKYGIIAKRKRKGIGKVAEELGCSRQNVYDRLKFWNKVEGDLKRYGAAIGCEVEIVFKDLETGEIL